MAKLLSETRGFRNNNPGNIEKSSSFVWSGEVEHLTGIQEENRFCQFCNLDFGIRALYRLLKTYREKHKISHVKGIISRFAPSHENDTDSYIDSIIKIMDSRYYASNPQGFTETDDIEKNYYPALVEGIIYHENGFCPITFSYLEYLFTWAVPEWQ